MEEKKLRWGVLGCSGVGSDRTVPGIINSAHGMLYALAGRDEKKLAKYAEPFHPVKTYTSYDALLDDPNVDAVYLPLPNNLHKEWVLKAAAKKKHILCEKPMALTEEDAREMFAAAEANGVLLMEAYAYQQAPLVQKVKELLDSGAIGQVKYLESVHTNCVKDKTGIRFKKDGGGNFYDVGCYNVSLAAYLFEEEPSMIHVYKEMDEETGVDVSSNMQFAYKSGMTASLYSAMNCYPKGRFSILGTEGRLEVLNKFNSRGLTHITVTKNGRGHNAEIIDEVSTTYTVWCEDNYMLEMEQFARCVLFGEQPAVSKELSLRMAAILDRVLKNSEAIQ